MQFKLSKNYYKYFVTFTENYYTLTTKRVKICCPGKWSKDAKEVLLRS